MRDPGFLSEHGKEDVLGPDVPVSQHQRLAQAGFQNLLRPGIQPDLPRGSARSRSGQRLHLTGGQLAIDPELIQGARRVAIAEFEQAEQQMLAADRAVSKLSRVLRRPFYRLPRLI